MSSSSNDNELVISGGSVDGGKRSGSSECFSSEGWKSAFPKLPVGMEGHCLVRCQFHKHFTSSFFIQMCCAHILCACSLGLYFWVESGMSKIGYFFRWKKICAKAARKMFVKLFGQVEWHELHGNRWNPGRRWYAILINFWSKGSSTNDVTYIFDPFSSCRAYYELSSQNYWSLPLVVFFSFKEVPLVHLSNKS